MQEHVCQNTGLRIPMSDDEHSYYSMSEKVIVAYY